MATDRKAMTHKQRYDSAMRKIARGEYSEARKLYEDPEALSGDARIIERHCQVREGHAIMSASSTSPHSYSAKGFAERMVAELETDLGVHHDEPFLRMSRLRLQELRTALRGLLDSHDGPNCLPREELAWVADQYDDTLPAQMLADRLYDVSCTAKKYLALSQMENSSSQNESTATVEKP